MPGSMLPFFLFAGLVLILSGCTQYGQTQAGGQTPSEISASAVVIKNFAFSPERLTVKVGTAVVWTNEDSVQHQIASDPHPAHTDLPGLASGSLSKGQSYRFVFDRAGTFGYHCHIHPSMKGTITVTG